MSLFIQVFQKRIAITKLKDVASVSYLDVTYTVPDDHPEYLLFLQKKTRFCTASTNKTSYRPTGFEVGLRDR